MLCLAYGLVDKNFSSRMAERACIVCVGVWNEEGSIAGNVCVNTTFPKLLLLNFSNLKN